ncbi:MFS multidrug transporter [Apiospora aurea]|uniref:MFS multidrug transporter n=1 Tax=Apiospora aurea TaxID=335848 RepID=A0ABR1QVN7_9PEZI
MANNDTGGRGTATSASIRPSGKGSGKRIPPRDDRSEQRYQISPAPTAEAGDETSGGGGGGAGGGDLTQEKTGESVEYISGFRLLAVMIAVVLAAFLMLLDISIISTAVPRITSDFHSLPDVGWYAGAYQLANSCLQPLTGKFYTEFSAKWTFLIFFLVFEVGSLVCGVATSSPMFIGGRVIAGLGSSGIMNGAMTLVAGAVALEKRPLYTGLMVGSGQHLVLLPLRRRVLIIHFVAIVAQLGLVCGPLIGGALTEYSTWRWCFYINLPLGGVTAVFLALTHVPDITEKPPFTLALLRRLLPELDLLGFVLFAPAAVMFLLALQLGGHMYAWGSSQIIGLFCGAVATGAVFVAWEWRMGDRAMLPGSMMKQRVVFMAIMQGLFLMVTTTVGSFYLPIYFQGVKGVGPTLSGVYMLPSILSQLLLVVVSGALISKIGYYLPFAVFGGALNAIGNGLLSTFTPTTETAKWVGYQIITGAGRGAAMQICIIAIQNALQPAQIPVGMSAMIFAQNFSAAVFTVVAATIFTQSLEAEITVRAPSIPPAAVSAAGASGDGVQALVPPGSPPELLGEVLLSYSNSVDRVFYLVTACAVITFVTAWGVGWKDTRQKKNTAATAQQQQGDEAA